MTGNRGKVILLLLLTCVSLTACGKETGWQRVDLSEKPEFPDHVQFPAIVARQSSDEVEDLEVRMLDLVGEGKDRDYYQALVAYHHQGRDLIYMGRVIFSFEGRRSVGTSAGQWHTRDLDQPVEYMVQQMQGTKKFHYVAVWTNSPHVHQIHIEVNGQFFDIEGEDIIVLRWEAPMHGVVEHLEVTAFDEDGVVIWQDEW